VSVFVDDDRGHFSRSHRIDDKLSRVLIPQDDIDALAANFARDGLNPRTAHADAGALRIDALVLGANGDLGPRTRITRRTHDLNEAFGDFWHFDAEQLDQHLRRSTRQNQLRAAVLSANFLEQCANTGTDAEGFTRNDVFASQQRFGVIAEVDDNAIAGHFLDRAGDDLTQTITIGFYHLRTLGLAHFLHDDLLGGLRRNTAELDGLDFLFEHITKLGVGITRLSLIQCQLMGRIFKVLIVYDSPATEGFVAAIVAIDFHTQINFVLVALLGSRGQGQLKRFENHTRRYALFIGHRLHNQQYFFAHRTPRLSQSIGFRGIRSQSKRGMMLALSIMSIGSRYSWSSTCTTTSCSSTPRRRPWKLRLPSKGERSFIFT